MDEPISPPSAHRRPGRVVAPGDGRHYRAPAFDAEFVADGGETDGRYSLSVWTLAPGFGGVGEHAHDDEDDVFLVMEGTITFVVDGVEQPCGPGTLVQATAGTRHDFRNDTGRPARMFNLFVPGEFESEMPAIVEWFRERSG